jgi:hypothetical protein
MTAIPGNVYIVRIAIPVADFRERLRDIDGAVFIRELPPARAVVAIPDDVLPQLTTLDGVTAITPDHLQHPNNPR